MRFSLMFQGAGAVFRPSRRRVLETLPQRSAATLRHGFCEPATIWTKSCARLAKTFKSDTSMGQRSALKRLGPECQDALPVRPVPEDAGVVGVFKVELGVPQE